MSDLVVTQEEVKVIQQVNIALYEQGYGIQFKLTEYLESGCGFTLVRSLELENDI